MRLVLWCLWSERWTTRGRSTFDLAGRQIGWFHLICYTSVSVVIGPWHMNGRMSADHVGEVMWNLLIDPQCAVMNPLSNVGLTNRTASIDYEIQL